jgi:hypothetical protein
LSLAAVADNKEELEQEDIELLFPAELKWN